MLKPYAVLSRTEGCKEEACLVFAHTVREAKKVAWAERGLIRDLTDNTWTDVKTLLLRDMDFLFKNADPEKLAQDEAHCNDFPLFCKGCGIWSRPIDDEDYCPDCAKGVCE